MTCTEYFDANAREWDEHPGKRHIASLFAAELQKNVALATTMNLLEFGCGTGLVSMELYGQVACITLLDTSPGMIEVLQEKIAHYAIDNMHPRIGDLSAIDRDKERFDLIYSNMVLHHVTAPIQTLSDLAELLKPGGVICIGDLETEDGSFHQGEMAVHHGFDSEQLAASIANLGLQVEHCYRSHTMQKTDALGQKRDYPLFFLQARKTAR